MLEVQQLSRSYGDLVAVDRVAFTVERGEVVGLLGHNGAGKTTIMKMLSGYLEPGGGRVTIDGIDIATDQKAAQRHLGYLPENLPVYPELTVADYLEYAAVLKGLQGAEKAAEIRRAIRATEIGNKLLSPIATLSRGYKQRVGVAQAILGRPGFLIMDEPTNGLDPTQTEHMRELIREVAQSATVLLSTHIMQEVDAVCDRVLILRAGRLVVDARLAQLRHSNQLLLGTSLAPAVASAALTALPGVSAVEPLPDSGAGRRYRLQLAPDAAAAACSAAVARAVLDAGADLYELRLQQRDLETLFREVSSAPVDSTEALDHAA